MCWLRFYALLRFKIQAVFRSSGYLVGEPGSKKDRVCNVLAMRLRVAMRQN